MSYEEKKTFCRVCEPSCGMVAVVEDGQLTALKPDKEHPVTKGFVCHKGLYGLDIHNDPDRLNVPLRRGQDGTFEESSWDVVIPEIAQKLQSVMDRHGTGALGVYNGNPMAFNTLFGPSYRKFLGQLGVQKRFSSGTQDCTNKFAASGAVFGTQTLHPIPDIENTDFLLMLGENPSVSHMSFISIADPVGALRAAEARGAKIVFVNPRTIETARFAGDVVHIRPDTDVYFLASLLCEMDRLDLIDRTHAAQHGRDVDTLLDFVRSYPAEKVEAVTRIPAQTVTDLAKQFGEAPSASIHMSTGVNMGRQGTLAYWLVHMISLLSGNLGHRGGNVYSMGFYARASKAATIRPGTEPTVDGPFGTMSNPQNPLITLPGNLMADYIQNTDDPIHAMFVTGGNPVLSVGGENRMRAALAELDLLVVTDIYRNATAEYAHYILPAAGAFERPDINMIGLGLQNQPSIQFSDAVVEPQFERKPEWWVFEKLASAMGLQSIFDEGNEVDLDATLWGRTDAMLRSREESMESLREAGTIVFDSVPPEDLFDHVRTEDGLVDCFPAAFQQPLQRMEDIFRGLSTERSDQLKLISKRDNNMMNSWYANVPKMKRKERSDNYLFMHPDDAQSRQLQDGQSVVVKNENGELTIKLKFSEDLMPGVVAITHGWGHNQSHGMTFAKSTPGTNVNVLLPSGPESYEPISNQAHMTGIPVEIVSA